MPTVIIVAGENTIDPALLQSGALRSKRVRDLNAYEFSAKNQNGELVQIVLCVPQGKNILGRLSIANDRHIAKTGPFRDWLKDPNTTLHVLRQDGEKLSDETALETMSKRENALNHTPELTPHIISSPINTTEALLSGAECSDLKPLAPEEELMLLAEGGADEAFYSKFPRLVWQLFDMKIREFGNKSALYLPLFGLGLEMQGENQKNAHGISGVPQRNDSILFLSIKNQKDLERCIRSLKTLRETLIKAEQNNQKEINIKIIRVLWKNPQKC